MKCLVFIENPWRTNNFDAHEYDWTSNPPWYAISHAAETKETPTAPQPDRLIVQIMSIFHWSRVQMGISASRVPAVFDENEALPSSRKKQVPESRIFHSARSTNEWFFFLHTIV